MEIRVLTHNDTAEYKRIRLESLQKDPEAFNSSYEEESAQPDTFFSDRIMQSDCTVAVGAFIENRLIATASFFRFKSSRLYHKGYVVGVYVAEGYRGQGIGKKVVAFLIDNVRAYNDISKLQLRVSPDNEAAKRVYMSCGFEKEGLERDAMRVNGISYDDDLMVCYLHA